MQRRSNVFVACCAVALATGLTLATPLPAAAKGNPKKAAATVSQPKGHVGQQAKTLALLQPSVQPNATLPVATSSPATTSTGRPAPAVQPSTGAATVAPRPLVAAPAPAPAPAPARAAVIYSQPAPQPESLPAPVPLPADVQVRLPVIPPLPPGPSVPILLFPLLLGLWLIIAARTLTSAFRQRDGRVRRLAATLDLDPTLARQLVHVPGTALSVLQDRVEAVTFDELTGVLRRGPGLAALDREIARAERAGTALAVAFVDIDSLKAMNDSQGHAAGDALIKAVAAALERRLRAADLVFRYGGDEFVCVLPETAEASARSKLAQIQTEAAAEGVSFCIGVAEYRRSDDVVSLLGRADQELYARKSERGVIRQLPDATSPKRRQPRPALR